MITLKPIKTRTDHYCSTCGETIPAGTWCMYWETREPKYNDDKQIGIQYFKAWFHNPPEDGEPDCWENAELNDNKL